MILLDVNDNSIFLKKRLIRQLKIYSVRKKNRAYVFLSWIKTMTLGIKEQ